MEQGVGEVWKGRIGGSIGGWCAMRCVGSTIWFHLPPYVHTLSYGSDRHTTAPAAPRRPDTLSLLPIACSCLPPPFPSLLSRSITPPSPPPPLLSSLPLYKSYHARLKNLSRVSYSGKDDLPLLSVVLHVHVHSRWECVCVLCMVVCVREGWQQQQVKVRMRWQQVRRRRQCGQSCVVRGVCNMCGSGRFCC